MDTTYNFVPLSIATPLVTPLLPLQIVERYNQLGAMAYLKERTGDYEGAYMMLMKLFRVSCDEVLEKFFITIASKEGVACGCVGVCVFVTCLHIGVHALLLLTIFLLCLLLLGQNGTRYRMT